MAISFHFQSGPNQTNQSGSIPPNFDDILMRFENYQSKNTYFSYSNIQRLENAKLKLYKNQTYFGQLVDGKKHGIGILLYENGRSYEGQFSADQKQGNGIETFLKGAYYEGQYHEGKPHGNGQFYWPNGEFYDGEWQDGLKHGYGRWQGIKNDFYQGEWVKGRAHGKGIHVWLNGDKYEGDFKNCLKNGEGKEYFQNGDFYQGTYLDGKPEGYGEYFWSNGAYFKGYFKDGLRNGKGLWIRINENGTQDQYQGDYVNDKKSGYGLFIWGNGSQYKGEFYDDYKHGQGEMKWVDGRYYNGQWDHGKMVDLNETTNPNNYQIIKKQSIPTPQPIKPPIRQSIKVRQYSSERPKQSELQFTQESMIKRQKTPYSGSTWSQNVTVTSGFNRVNVSTSSNSRRPSKSYVTSQKPTIQKPETTTAQIFFQKSNPNSRRPYYLKRPNTNNTQERWRPKSNEINNSFF